MEHTNTYENWKELDTETAIKLNLYRLYIVYLAKCWLEDELEVVINDISYYRKSYLSRTANQAGRHSIATQKN
jgi:hypothetical protein